MSGNDFTAIIKVVAFLAAIWFTGRLCRFISVSPLIGWIATGMLLGPDSFQLINSEESHVWKVLGTLGVTLLIAESGTHIHFDKIKKVGLSAIGVAIIGTFLPLCFGLVLSKLFNEAPDYKSAFAAGCTMSPTSVGVALKVLTEANELNSLSGQTIVTAAFLDDVFSIILLVILQSLKPDGVAHETESHGEFNGITGIALSFIFCFLFLAIGTLFALHCFSKYLPSILHLIPMNEMGGINYQPRDEIHLISMIFVLIGYSFIGDKIGSHLLGAFIAGMSFSQVPRSMYVWRRQLKRLTAWLVRLFFACSVGFTIPINELLSFNAFWKGLIFAIIAGVIGKVLSGFAVQQMNKENRLLIGFAMVGRGEFAYLVARQAFSSKLISPELYAIIVWSLLLAVITAPICFSKILSHTKNKTRLENMNSRGIKYFSIQAEGQHHNGIHFEIVDVLHNLKLDILEAKVETDGDVDLSTFIVEVGGKYDDGNYLDEDKIHEILHDIREAVDDESAMVQLLPINENYILPIQKSSSPIEAPSLTNENNHTHVHTHTHNNDDYYLEIKFMSTHSPKIFVQVIKLLESLKQIQVVRGYMEDFLNTDSQTIFCNINNEFEQIIDIKQIKKSLKQILKENNICGETLVRKIRKDNAILPNHPKFSDLLQTSNNKNNPLLSNKIQNGYEIDIFYQIDCQEEQTDLLSLISKIFENLKLDIRTVDIGTNLEEENNPSHSDQWNVSFFVQESINDEFDANNRRNNIECQIVNIFKNKNIKAKIKTKAIQMGQKNDDKENNINTNNIVIETINIKSDDENNNNNNDTTLQNIASITQSTTIITPKRQSTLPPKIETSETTFNLIGFLQS